MKCKSLFLGISLLCAGAACAVPALPGLLEYVQPDGSVVTVRLVGDEHFHYYTDESGRCLVPDDKGFLVASQQAPAAQKNVNRAPWKARDSKYTSYPTTGHQKALVVMVQFSDNAFTYGYDSFNDMLNQPGYSTYGSARDYYVENSGGNFLPEFDLYGPVTLSHPMSYYSADDDARAYEMVVEACRTLDSEVNFADYDRDGDGWVDNVYVFYAGYGEADGGGYNTVWPHSSNVFRKGTTLLLDGVQIGQYACSNELIANSRSIVGIGTFCHEFGHVLGLPDLYSVSDSSILTPGYWSLMDHGNYANNGRCPVAMTAYERYFLGWTEPMVLSGRSDALLPSVDNNFGFRIDGSDSEEYFILEYRRKTGWDSYAPGEGLLVWHIDYDRDAWNMNTVNNYESQQRVRILPADGVRTVVGDAGDTYPGTTGATSIPDFKSWNGFSSGVALTDINADGVYVTFKVNGGSAAPQQPSFDITEVADCEATVTFDTAGALVSLSYTEQGRKRFVPGYTFAATSGATLALEGLTPSTEYTVTAYASAGTSMSLPVEKKFVTDEPGIRFYAPANLVVSAITADGFTLGWDALPMDADYLLTVWHQGEGDAAESTVDFSDRTNLPDGWTTTATNTMSVNGYFGAASPSLRLMNNAEIIESPVFSEPIKTLSFWLRGYQAATASSLDIYGYVDGQWKLIDTVGAVSNTAGTTYTYTDRLENATAVRFVYNAVSGSFCIDDIRVGLGNATVVVTDLDAVAVPDGALTYTVTGLEKETKYYASVVGTDGKHTSQTSAIAEATTGTLDAVNAITAVEATAADVYDIAGHRVATGVTSLADLRLLPGVYIVRDGRTVRKVFVR